MFCGAFPQACAVPPKPALELWACRDREACPGRVTFGALPSSDGRALAILAPPRARAKRLVVERPSMIRWFDVLE